MAEIARKTALVMGVANQRSIAWACVRSLAADGWDVVATYQNDRFEAKVQGMASKLNEGGVSQGGPADGRAPRVVALPCDAKTEIPILFEERIPEAMKADFGVQDAHPKLDAIVHSIGHAPNLKTTPLIDATLDDFLEAHHISAYSLLEMSRSATRASMLPPGSSITALTYLGAARAISNYRTMGPAKASLESIVRGLAAELGGDGVRVNAVSAGPIPTLAAKGGVADFGAMREDVARRAPLGNVTAEQVAEAVHFLASRGAGITGQTIYVDGGYSIVSGPALTSE